MAILLDLLPLILAVPFGVLANLITPKISSIISKRSKIPEPDVAGTRQENMERAMNLATDKTQLAYHFITVFLKIALIVAMTSIVANVLRLTEGVLRQYLPVDLIYLWHLINLVYIVGAVIVIRMIREGLRDIEKVKSIEEYKSLIRDQKQERD